MEWTKLKRKISHQQEQFFRISISKILQILNFWQLEDVFKRKWNICHSLDCKNKNIMKKQIQEIKKSKQTLNKNHFYDYLNCNGSFFHLMESVLINISHLMGSVVLLY